MFLFWIGCLSLFLIVWMCLRSSRSVQPDTWESHVLPHQPIKEVFPNLWMVTGTLRMGPPRNMVIYKMKNGDLIIHSCIALNEESMLALERLGKFKILIVPSSFHTLDARVYKTRYPHLLVLCPEAARKDIEQKIKVDDTCENVLPFYKEDIAILTPEGIDRKELIYEVNVPGGKALIVTDLLFNIPARESWIGTILGSTTDGKHPRVTRLFKFFAVKNKKELALWLRRKAQHYRETGTLKAIIVAHGYPIFSDCAECLEYAANSV